MTDRVRRALVSAYDKAGLLPFCRELHELGVEIVSSGGTARLLDEAGVPVVRVSDHTGFPEMLDGRVKTLHPRVHGGILAVRSNPTHVADLEREGISPIDLVVVNLYPFERTASRPDAAFHEVIEMIDVGGPAMLRAAAKNHAHVGVVVDPSDYPGVIAELKAHGALAPKTRLRLAGKAFSCTAAYDAAIAAYLSGRQGPTRPGAHRTLTLSWEKALDLRYGENPHQDAAFYLDPEDPGASVARAHQLQGKEISFNNVLDLDAALVLAAELPATACAIVKHGNPCGAAVAGTPLEAFRKALACDPVSAFGGVIAFNRVVDRAAAEAVAEAFYEAVIAPEFDDGARSALGGKKNLRLLEVGPLSDFHRGGLDLRRVSGGLLVQDWDAGQDPVRDGRVASRRGPSEDEWSALVFAWAVVKHVKSNAIVYARSDRTVGIGAGQMSRIDSARLGIEKAQRARVPLQGAVMASDAFFPFRDGIDVAAEAGIRAVVQPGGSMRDDEVIQAADEHTMAMVFTGRRHFRH